MRLYTVFHANLDFSALPDADRSRVIERCYWPLLRIPEELGIPIGFEASVRTLQILADEDPEWLKRLRGLAERGLVEPIASGHAQIVAPLAPVEINRRNLALGRRGYRALLGTEPETWFVHEQTFCDGLVPLFEEAGAARVVMEWNNPAARQPELRRLRGQPARLGGAFGPGPVLLWNDSIFFQKVQRVAHGVIPEKELFDYLERLDSDALGDRLCFYGGDVEIFDYRPSRVLPAGTQPGAEMQRLFDCFRRVTAEGRHEWLLPRDAVEPGEALPNVTLGSAADPIPCKKQPRYNPTRWAVSGRDGFAMNGRCHGLLRTERIARALVGESPDAASAALVELWRSDFRTRATEEKLVEFEAGMGLAVRNARESLGQALPLLAEGSDLLLANPWPETWGGHPVEIPLRMPSGRHFGRSLSVKALSGEAPAAVQLDVTGRHRDGSIRDAVLVLLPTIEAGATLRLRFEATTDERSARSDFVACEAVGEAAVEGVRTRTADVKLLPHRGGALESVSFPAVASAPLFGTVGHGTFDRIDYSPDFYSGHVVAVLEDGSKHTDLKRVEVRRLAEACGPVRETLEAVAETRFGPWRKRIRLYRDRPRIEVDHELGFHEVRLASLRLGIVTLRPDAWDRATLRFGACHGGPEPRWHELAPGVRLEQSKAVSPSVSATSCLGATEGWLALEDRNQGLLLEGDRSLAACVPLLDFEEVDDRFFARVSHTAAESDETRASFLRGIRRMRFAFEAYRRTDRTALAGARLRQRGLAYRTENDVGICAHV